MQSDSKRPLPGIIPTLNEPDRVDPRDRYAPSAVAWAQAATMA